MEEKEKEAGETLEVTKGSAISDDPRLIPGEKALLKRKLLKFVCGTCDMGLNAPAQHAEALPRVAELLVRMF